MTRTARSRRRRVGFVALAVCLAPSAALARPYMTPEFMTKVSRPMRVAILPAQAYFMKSQAVMTADMVKEANALEDEAGQVIETQLVDKQYGVRVITPKDFDDLPGLKELVTSVNSRYDEEWSKILGSRRDVRHKRFSAGDQVVQLCSLLKVDGLVVPRIVASAPTGGRVALTMILSLGQAAEHGMASMGLGVLAGRDGRVEGYFSGSTSCTLGGLVKHPEKVMTRLVEKIMKRYPAAAEVLETRQEVETATTSADDASDDSAIDNFEAALQQKTAAATPAPAGSPAPATAPVPAASPSPSPTPGPVPQVTPAPEVAPAPQPTPAPSAPGGA